MLTVYNSSSRCLAVHMGRPSGSDRPAKRRKQSQPYQRPLKLEDDTSSPTDAAPVVVTPDSAFGSWHPQTEPVAALPTAPSSLYDQQPPVLQAVPDQLPPSQQFFYPTSPGYQSGDGNPQPSVSIASLVTGYDPDTTSATTSPSSPHQQLPHSQPIAPLSEKAKKDSRSRANRKLSTVDERRNSDSQIITRQHELRQHELVSPFRDCLDSFASARFPTIEFRRPHDGYVNGYVKFRWAGRPQRSTSTQLLPPAGHPTQLLPGVLEHSPLLPAAAGRTPIPWLGTPTRSTTGILNDPTLGSAAAAALAAGVCSSSPVALDFPSGPDFTAAPVVSPTTTDLTTLSPTQTEPVSSFVSSASSPELPSQDSVAVLAPGGSQPKMLPPQFGFQAKMETSMDRRFWEFYVKNWCPGRSILKTTNLWLNDFAQMQGSEGIRAAIQSLAGVYIYDYVPQAKVSKRVNELFKIAETRLTQLLNHPQSLDVDHGNEIITIAVILSMQDIVLTERRLKKPHHPRWLQGFLHSEHALQKTDPGSRFWRPTNIQLSSLRVSQSIIVGRAVILAQPMMPLQSRERFDPEEESRRFGWLLYGTEQEMYEIHGGCGFSKKLLHLLSQTTYCAARLLQSEESPVAPITAQFVLNELQEMRQWSSESRDWAKAKEAGHIIDWVRTLPRDYRIDTPENMTDVTAEAWRIAGLIYVQCRALRLPRNHPNVVANLHDLASCIKIMPTSGHHFTAQAPLFPVFLLGMLATEADHKQISKDWFEQVVQTPVRSSVPPLFQALKRIWTWIDDEIPLDNEEPNKTIAMRNPWWEHLVARAHENEPETLCLT